MGKGRSRHNPDKSQNKMGKFCSYYEYNDKFQWCERGYDVSKCKGNPHNCVKVMYQVLASRSDIQKNNGVGVTNHHY